MLSHPNECIVQQWFFCGLMFSAVGSDPRRIPPPVSMVSAWRRWWRRRLGLGRGPGGRRGRVRALQGGRPCRAQAHRQPSILITGHCVSTPILASRPQIVCFSFSLSLFFCFPFLLFFFILLSSASSYFASFSPFNSFFSIFSLLFFSFIPHSYIFYVPRSISQN